MREQPPLAVIWRRKRLVLATCVAAVAAAAAVTLTLDKVYSSSSTLLVSLPANEQTFDTVQASQALARSYADIIDSPGIAAQVARRLRSNKDAILDAVSFEAVPETQLLKIHAEDESPQRASAIANTYAGVFMEFARARLAGTTKANLSLAESAPVSDDVVRPKPLLYGGVAGLLGLALGAAFALLRDRFDRRLRSSEEVEAKFELPVVGRVPRRGRTPASAAGFEEAYRILRTNLQFVSPEGRPRSIAVTSARDGEGKTTTVARLAIASAETGLEVAAVEADFRRPALSELLVQQHGQLRASGLSNHLSGGASLEEVVRATDYPAVRLLTSGPLPPSPATLLESTRSRSLVSELARTADLVLIDCPPLNVAADASVISRWVDGVLVVVDLERSTDRSLQAALRQLEAVQANLIGLVLNRDPGTAMGDYGYYIGGVPERSQLPVQPVPDRESA